MTQPRDAKGRFVSARRNDDEMWTRLQDAIDEIERGKSTITPRQPVMRRLWTWISGKSA